MKLTTEQLAEITTRHEEYEVILDEMRIAYADSNLTPIELLGTPHHQDRGRLIDHIADLEYRHECLKMLYADKMNYVEDAEVDFHIDEFIKRSNRTHDYLEQNK